MPFIQKHQLIAGAALAVLIFAGIISASVSGPQIGGEKVTAVKSSRLDLEEVVAPEKGVELPVVWGDLGKRMTDAGVIDGPQFEAIYAQRGGLSDADKALLYGADNGKLVMNRDNAGLLLNLLWGLGLGNKNAILEKGPMMDPQYGGAGRFASTGGWSIAKGDPMTHYSHYSFIELTAEQQQKVERVSKNIYRPCCGNSTYFPDCNHGMAMLALLELMASQGVSEDDMYKTALAVNSYWFPDTYVTIASYFKMKGIEWTDVDPKQALGNDFSSASGIQRVTAEVDPGESAGGGSCGV